MSLRAVHATKPEDGLRGLNPSRAPDGIPQARWNRGMPAGQQENKTLAWLRGHQAGVYDAYRTIKKKYPRVAAQLITAFEMNEKGDISL